MFRSVKTYLSAVALLAVATTHPAAAHGDGEVKSEFAHAIEHAHNAEAYYAAGTIKADLHTVFPGMGLDLKATMTFTPSMSKARMDFDDGTTVVWDGSTVWVSPESAANPMLRFHVLTWPYFLAMPYKLQDPGANLEPAGIKQTTKERFLKAAKLTFGEGVGDAPDDWYYVFKNADNVMEAASYIVTFGTDVSEAEKKPSIILYSDHQAIDGVPIPMRWDFHFWDIKDGASEEAKGSTDLSEVSLIDPPAGHYDKPEGAVEVAAP